MRYRAKIYLPAVAWLLTAAFASAAEPFRYPEGKHGQAELRYINGLPVLSVRGTPEEIGEQTVALAGRPAERLLSYPRDVMRAFGAKDDLLGNLAYGSFL